MGGKRGAVVNAVGQGNDVSFRIVIIREISGDTLNLHVVKPVAVEYLPRRLSRRDSSPAGNAVVFVECGFNVYRAYNSENKRPRYTADTPLCSSC